MILLKKSPKKLFIFDMNKTLDILPGEDKGPLRFKEIFNKLTKKGYWVGTTSGMNPWMQSYYCYKAGTRPDFTIFKHEIIGLVNSIKAYYALIDLETHYVGDSEEDKWFAYYSHCVFHTPDEFIDYLKKERLME